MKTLHQIKRRLKNAAQKQYVLLDNVIHNNNSEDTILTGINRYTYKPD